MIFMAGGIFQIITTYQKASQEFLKEPRPPKKVSTMLKKKKTSHSVTSFPLRRDVFPKIPKMGNYRVVPEVMLS